MTHNFLIKEPNWLWWH